MKNLSEPFSRTAFYSSRTHHSIREICGMSLQATKPKAMRKLDMKEVRDIVYPLRNQPVPPSMRYSMEFYDNSDKLMIAISDCTFISPVLDFDKLKSRFNNDFVKGKARVVKITFTDYKSVNKTFICGFRGNPGKVVIIDTDNNLEMSVMQFSESLKVLENMLDCPDPIQYLEQ